MRGDFRTESGYDLTRRLLRLPDPPTGILCGNDRMALGAYFALMEAGLRVPDDMSVVGYDDQEELASVLRPALSTILLPYRAMGEWAVKQILEGSVDRLPPRTLLPCPPVPRASVGPPRARGRLTPG